MKLELHLDFESRAPFSPSDIGLHNYIFSPKMEPLFLWYRPGAWVKSRFDYDWKADAKCWHMWEESLELFSEGLKTPADLDMYLRDPEVMLVAYNSAFERYMLQRLGYTIPVDRFIDPQVYGRYLSLPASLDVQCEVLDVPEHLSKMKRGKELVKLFCEKVVIKATRKRETTEFYNDWNSHPAEWQEFLEYGRQDVIAEAELLRRERILGAYPLPETEQRLWLLDQKVNDRGMPLDVDFVSKMYSLAIRAKEEAKKNFEEFTGVANANSPAQVKKWAAAQGYPYPSLNKDIVTSALKDSEIQLTDACRKALQMRREAASTSYQKLGKMLEAVSLDKMLRCQFIFMGSSRCGRWTGNAVQLQNMARPGVIEVKDETGKVIAKYDFESQKVVKEARAMIYANDYEAIKKKYGTVLLVVKNLIRTVFVTI